MQVSAANTMPIEFYAWKSDELADGRFNNTRLTESLGRTAVTLKDGEQTGTWTSPTYRTEEPFNKAVASWQASTPGESRIETHLQVQTQEGQWSKWYNMGHWAFANNVDANGNITSMRGFAGEQADEIGSIDQDTFWVNDNLWAKAYKIRSVLYAHSDHKPLVRQVAAVTSDYLKNQPGATSPTTMRHQVELPVPALSQYAHNGEYPQFDGGGAAWCSPASVSMVLRYYGVGPSAQDIAALPSDPVFDQNQRRDGDLDYAVHHTFDNGYANKNTGNWPLNTAYAAAFGLDTSVRQYNSLHPVEHFIKKGVPVIITLKWDNTDLDPTNDLTGSLISKTNGHLMVVRGFTETGNVIVNDPAAPQGNEQARHIYDRGEIERLWLKAKGGTVYLIKPFRS